MIFADIMLVKNMQTSYAQNAWLDLTAMQKA